MENTLCAFPFPEAAACAVRGSPALWDDFRFHLEFAVIAPCDLFIFGQALEQADAAAAAHELALWQPHLVVDQFLFEDEHRAGVEAREEQPERDGSRSLRFEAYRLVAGFPDPHLAANFEQGLAVAAPSVITGLGRAGDH